jgi:hypothetical protein
MRCQAVRIRQNGMPSGEDGDTEVKEKDVDVLSEYRGSAIIERYVDPNDKELGNYDYQTSSIDPYYRFRVIATKQFTPR